MKFSGNSAIVSRFNYAYNSNASTTNPLDSWSGVGKQYGNSLSQYQTQTYAYNATSMLTGEDGAATSGTATPQLHKTYGYDAMGNRTNYSDYYANQLTATSTYNNLNQITQTNNNQNTVTGFGYDADGNMTGAYTSITPVSSTPATGVTYGYDEENRLISITYPRPSQVSQNPTPNSQYRFVYDGLSRLRISRYYVRNANTDALELQNETRRVYDGMDVVQERDANNLTTASYTRTGNIGGILARTSSSDSVFYSYDGGGNVVSLTNGSGAEVGSYTYDAFGNTIASSGAAASENPYRFSTKEQIGGLYSYGFRFYSPGLGRWINRDPIGENGGTNLYGFVGNDPVNQADAHGLIGVAVQVTIFQRDFTIGTPGYGHFGGDLLFDSSSAHNLGRDIQKGGDIVGDALNPLGDPYADAGAYSLFDSDVAISRALTFTGVGAGAAAGGLFLATGGAVFSGGSFATFSAGSAARATVGSLWANPIVQGAASNGASAFGGELLNLATGEKGDIRVVGRAVIVGGVAGYTQNALTSLVKKGNVGEGGGGVAGGLVAGWLDRGYSKLTDRH